VATQSLSVATLIHVLEHAPSAAYLLRYDEDDFVLEAVNARARAASPALSKMLGRRVSMLYRDQPEIIGDALRCMREKATVVRETRVRRHDRIEANQQQRLTFVCVEPEHLVIHVEDVAHEQNTEAALAETQEHYRSLVASVPDAVLVRHADGSVLACNDVAAELFGRQSQADLMGQIEILAPGIRIETLEGDLVRHEDLPSLQVARTGKAVRRELFIQFRPDGTQRYVRLSSEPLRARDGSVAGSVSLYADETVRILAERAQRQSAERLELALDAARMGYWEWEPESDIGSWSPTLTKKFDLEGVGGGFAAFVARIHPDDRQVVQQVAREIVESREARTFEHEFRLVGNDGVTRWARSQGRTELKGGKLHLAGTLMDVTERHRLEEELRRAHRLESIGRLAGGLAHDFNNLLAAMLGSLELLQEVCPEAGREDLSTARHAAERARDLTAQLLAFARKQPIVLGPVDLSQLVQRVERLLDRLVGPTITLQIDAEPDLMVKADAPQLEQVLVNLAVNARDAMPQGGVLRVRATGDHRHLDGEREVVVLEVEDQGSGMDAETVHHVFDPFFTTKEAGTGLGLASSYGIVQQHGGDILVDSEPGRGARFRVLLPRIGKSPSAQIQPTQTSAGTGCVLVVDDEDSVRRTTARLLKSLGYEVVLAKDGAEALTIAQTHPLPIDILVCDLAMPEHNGPEVSRQVTRARPNIRTLFVSGYSKDSAEAVAAADFLQKPYTRAALSEKLKALASNRK
jgi:PAS domain S-box-containing protein